jgi:hypothetical protein
MHIMLRKIYEVANSLKPAGHYLFSAVYSPFWSTPILYMRLRPWQQTRLRGVVLAVSAFPFPFSLNNPSPCLLRLIRGIAVFPLFGLQMYHKLGNQWATSLLAFLTVAMMPFPYIFFKYGKKIRGKSRFASA